MPAASNRKRSRIAPLSLPMRVQLKLITIKVIQSTITHVKDECSMKRMAYIEGGESDGRIWHRLRIAEID